MWWAFDIMWCAFVILFYAFVILQVSEQHCQHNAQFVIIGFDIFQKAVEIVQRNIICDHHR